MSVTIYPWSKPGKQSPAGPEYGDCCGLRPVLLRWPRQIYIGVICQNPGCINSHNGVLACDVDIVEKWEYYRVKIEELKPCPFCGSVDVKIAPIPIPNFPDSPPLWAVGCKNCFISISGYGLEETARDAWNRRPTGVPEEKQQKPQEGAEVRE